MLQIMQLDDRCTGTSEGIDVTFVDNFMSVYTPSDDNLDVEFETYNFNTDSLSRVFSVS